MRRDRKRTRKPARMRIRAKLAGQDARPRVAVYRSLNHIYLQAIDDMKGQTIEQVSSQTADVAKDIKNGGTVEAATKVGTAMAERLKKKGIESIVFDRGGFVYHGRVKAAAEAMRKAGLKF